MSVDIYVSPNIGWHFLLCMVPRTNDKTLDDIL